MLCVNVSVYQPLQRPWAAQMSLSESIFYPNGSAGTSRGCVLAGTVLTLAAFCCPERVNLLTRLASARSVQAACVCKPDIAG